MPIPADFSFSQGSLQDYVDCPRRFYLRYVRRLTWPAVESEPILEQERRMQAGQAFHRLVHQHALGIPLDRLRPDIPVDGGASLILGDDLGRWWRNYLLYPAVSDQVAISHQKRYPEITLSAPLRCSAGQDVVDYRLVARYDLIVIEPERPRAVIVDWKTSARQPRPGWLADRLQTRVYRYLLVRAGHPLNGGKPLAPEQVEMLYWFADFPQQPVRFPYDAASFAADEAYLSTLVGEIAGGAEQDFPLTERAQACQFCVYRSLCARGVEAGAMDEETAAEVGSEIDFAFEQIAEVPWSV
jgi:hypothetical protein